MGYENAGEEEGVVKIDGNTEEVGVDCPLDVSAFCIIPNLLTDNMILAG